MENIKVVQVRYKPILGGAAYHKYIVYYDKNGDVYAARGGPENSALSGLSGSGSGSSGFGWGRIETEYGRYAPGFSDYTENNDDPREIIKIGNDLSEYWESIKRHMDEIENANYPYDQQDQIQIQQ